MSAVIAQPAFARRAFKHAYDMKPNHEGARRRQACELAWRPAHRHRYQAELEVIESGSRPGMRRRGAGVGLATTSP